MDHSYWFVKMKATFVWKEVSPRMSCGSTFRGQNVSHVIISSEKRYQSHLGTLCSISMLLIFWTLNNIFWTSFLTKPDSKRYHFSSIIDGFLSGYDTGLIDNCGMVHRYVIFADFSCNKRDPIRPEDMKNAMKKITAVKM